jgi:hypothetical protein
VLAVLAILVEHPFSLHSWWYRTFFFTVYVLHPTLGMTTLFLLVTLPPIIMDPVKQRGG